MHPATRPVLRPGLRLLRSASGQGVLVEHGRVFPLDHVTATLLEHLDRTGGEPEASTAATGTADQARAAWSRLREAGVVVDLEEPAALVRDLDMSARAQGLHEACAMLAHDPACAAQRGRLRRDARVVVSGRGAVAVSLLRLLDEAGVGEAHEARAARHDDRHDPDVTVLADDHEPATDLVERLMRAGLPHLDNLQVHRVQRHARDSLLHRPHRRGTGPA